jgi:hypothetical protein
LGLPKGRGKPNWFAPLIFLKPGDGFKLPTEDSLQFYFGEPSKFAGEENPIMLNRPSLTTDSISYSC